MRLTYGVLAAGVILGALPIGAFGDVLAQYNFGSTNVTGETLATMELPTTVSPNVSTTSISLGGNTTAATDEGATVAGFYTSPGPNYLSVANNEADPAPNDLTYFVDFTVTANAGFQFTPTSFTLVGGAGGTTNVRSFLLFDNVDGFPTAITATTTAPTVVGGTQIGGATFTAARNTGVAMNSFTSNFPGTDQNLTSFEVRVFFDTQFKGEQKNIDLGSLTLNGTVSAATAAPEPAALAYMGLAAASMLTFPRRRKLCR